MGSGKGVPHTGAARGSPRGVPKRVPQWGSPKGGHPRWVPKGMLEVDPPYTSASWVT